ncbi:MAG: hypothetical protein MZW92_43630 [Comamonadaceae bacterium]|nr:hypothetical protein [Comamonadaceae bacterium]
MAPSRSCSSAHIRTVAGSGLALAQRPVAGLQGRRHVAAPGLQLGDAGPRQ